MLTFGSLFSGIGGIDLGLERAGMKCVWQVENNPFCQKILQKHWPNIPKYWDIKTAKILPYADLLCGGPPCQPVSLAGKQKEENDERWLWPEFAKAIRNIRPKYVLLENVPGLLVRAMGIVLKNLAEIGYDAEWQVLSAAAFGAPHLRERVFIIAYPCGNNMWEKTEKRLEMEQNPLDNKGKEENPNRFTKIRTNVSHSNKFNDDSCRHDSSEISQQQAPKIFGCEKDNAAYSYSSRRQKYWQQQKSSIQFTQNRQWAIEPDVGRVAHGIPNRVDRLKALGNAVVPQIAEYLGNLIINYETENNP